MRTGSETISNESDSTSPILGYSAKHVKKLNERWLTPHNVKELASQATEVATMILNGSINRESAKSYSAIVRSIAQLMSAETSRARMQKEAPDLNL